MTRIPREYTAQDHLDMAGHFEHNVSTDPMEVARRRALRGKHANIADDEAAGENVGTRTLELLGDDPDSQEVWTGLYAVTLFNTALYRLRDTEDQPMSRTFKLVKPLVGIDGKPRDNEERRSDTFDTLRSIQHENEGFAQAEEVRQPTQREISRLGHRLGSVSFLVGIFNSDFYETDTELAIMERVLARAKATQATAQELARTITINPSVAQLRSESTPFGAHIVQSRAYPGEVKTAFRSAVGEVSDELGY